MRDTWARRIADLAAVPRVFRGFIPEECAGAFPYAIYAPADRWGFGKFHPKLLYLMDGRLSFLALGRRGVSETHLSLGDVTCLEVGRILLRAWVKVSGLVQGERVSVTMEFNSVIEDLFQPVVQTIRAAAAGIMSVAGDEVHRREREKLDYLGEKSYKFMNLAKISLMPGETVMDTAFEPGVRVRTFFGTRTIVPAHLAVLTGHELISIRDPLHGGRETYGAIWSYVPLCKVEDLAVEEAGDGNQTLRVRLTGGDCLVSRFAAIDGSTVRRFREACEDQRDTQVPSPTPSLQGKGRGAGI